MHQKTLAQLMQDLMQRRISSTEITQHFLSRIKKYDKQLNSFITLTDTHAMEHAQKIDQQKKPAGLQGIPMAHKDIFCTQGIKTSAGAKMLDNFIPPYNATIVNKLQDAGTIMLGKTNMDGFAMGSSNENSFYGACKNPWDLNCVPGGSSGGSAAAVAARLIPFATGTDTGGSIRQPAALCGITGLKPTYGRVSRYGMIAFASSLDQAGVFTQTAEDAAHVLNVMAGFDEKDSTSVNQTVPDYTAMLNQPLRGLKVGLPKEYFDTQLSPPISDKIHQAAKILESLGATIQDISLPYTTDLAIATYYIIAPAEASSNLSRYDGVRYGHRCENPKNLEDLYKRSRSEGFGQETKKRILTGTYVLSSGYYDAYYLKAQKVRRLIAQDFQSAFKEVDIILGPTTPTPAFKLGEKEKTPSMYLSDIYTTAVNLAGLPALSMPAGFIDHLPVGAQLIGNHFTEAKLLNVAHQYQQHTDWHTRMPKGFS